MHPLEEKCDWDGSRERHASFYCLQWIYGMDLLPATAGLA